MASSLDADALPQQNDCVAELQAALQISISIDLISAAKWFLGFLRIVSGLPHLHGGSSAIHAIRRYLNCWVPILAKMDSTSGKDLVPPLDVQWVWICHCLNPKAYQLFCKVHFSNDIHTPVFKDPSGKSVGWERCRQLWGETYPNEPFEIELTQKTSQSSRRSQSLPSLRSSPTEEKELMECMSKQITFYNQVSQQYMHHDGFLSVAKERYLCFLHMVNKSKRSVAFVPTCDIQLMWKCHQASPVAYAQDMTMFDGNLELNEPVLGSQQQSSGIRGGFEETARTWETLFGHPYERAGAAWPEVADMADEVDSSELASERIPVTINWHGQTSDKNAKHEFLQPRYVLEVCVHIKNVAKSENLPATNDDVFLMMKLTDACKNFKHQVSIKSYRYDTLWHKLSCMQCEVSTKGLVIELKAHAVKCLGFYTLLGQASLKWEELEKERLLACERPLTIRDINHSTNPWIVLASITPPVQAPYLFKALLDRVTDDAGAMVSRKVVRMNKYKPQEGRWMSRTVLNHAGKECFVIRIRVAAGVWRSKTERPVGVDWNERIICIHGGGWKYISSSTGIAPENILATATPLNDELEQYKMKWSFSTGETLTIQMPIEDLEWERHLRFSVKGNRLGVVRLQNGRHMQYEVPSAVPEEEEGFVTLVRYTAEARQGRATALFNWKLSAMEVLPEEDAVLVMLLCIATQRGVADLGGKTLRNFYDRRSVRKREARRHWGSVVMGGGEEVPSQLMFWYMNPEDVLGVNLEEMDNEEVLPQGASEQMYRGTSWLYAGSSKGLYKMSSKGSVESLGYDELARSSGPLRFGSQTKTPTAVR